MNKHLLIELACRLISQGSPINGNDLNFYVASEDGLRMTISVSKELRQATKNKSEERKNAKIEYGKLLD